MIDRDLLAVWLWAGLKRLRGEDSERGEYSERGEDSERGDVPGWVMVTVMTAAFVVVLIGLFKDRLGQIVQDALDSVTGEAGP